MKSNLIIKGAKIFDGISSEPRFADIAVAEGKIDKIGENLSQEVAVRSIDASGLWLFPGLMDIHTHEDLEAELDPGLPEVTRHGTTSVIVGNCSIGLAFGNQRVLDCDPIVDCFARVENIPKSVLRKTAEKAIWRTPREYLDHLDSLPLSADIAPFLPHSMLRIEVMGMEASISRDPTKQELERMSSILAEALESGYIGMSTDGLPLHYLANEPNVKKRIPTQYAEFEEYKMLTDVLRDYDRVWQMTPSTDNQALAARLFMLSSGRIHGKPLKVTALAALDTVNNRLTKYTALLFAKMLNTKFLDGKFRMQALAAPFRIYSEGPISPLAEADPLMRQLIETELENREKRVEILSDPDFIESFREMWNRGKAGFSASHLRRILKLESEFLTRDLRDMEIFRSPVPTWEGSNMAELYLRYQTWRKNPESIDCEEERYSFDQLGKSVRDDGEFFVSLLRTFDRDLHWNYVAANKDPEVVKKLLLNPGLIPGFNDSGAHVTNMAFFDGNLRALRLAMDDSEELVAHMTKRLTSEPAEFFGLPPVGVGVGQSADFLLVDPQELASYDGESTIRYEYRDLFGCHQLVNRSEGLVAGVFKRGQEIWNGSDFTDLSGREKLGGALRALPS